MSLHALDAERKVLQRQIVASSSDLSSLSSSSSSDYSSDGFAGLWDGISVSVSTRRAVSQMRDAN